MPAATKKRQGKESAAAQEAATSQVPHSISSMLSLFPVAHPVPSPAEDLTLIPASDVTLEQDLLLRQDDVRAWKSYIEHVVLTNAPKDRHVGYEADATWTPAQRTLLGVFASHEARQALRRTISVYERALALFPYSYSLWLAYLLARTSYVCGAPTGGLEKWRTRVLEAGRRNLDAGPALLEEEQRDEWEWKEGKALDGRVGYREWSSLAAAYERALMCLPKMPRIWLLYLSVISHPLAPSTLTHTHARRTFDRCLRTLPPSLHLRIWKVYLLWAEARGGETCLRVWRRYLMADPSLTERFVGTLMKMRAAAAEEAEEQEAEGEEQEARVATLNRLRGIEAAKLLLRLAKDAGDGKYTSPEGKSPYQLLVEWLELCERYGDEIGMTHNEEDKLLKALASTTKNKDTPKSVIRASDLDSLSPEPLPVGLILRELGIARFPDQAGRLWTGLATYWIKRTELDAARDVFEEGMRSVVTVRDFTQIFDAYAETSENVISYLMEELAAEDADEDEEEEQSKEDKEKELDERMREFEELMERRPFLINDVLLRRNPNDVQEWEKRVVLHGADDDKVVETYNEAIATINPRKATPNLHALYVNFAKFYEAGGASGEGEADFDSARKVLEKATTVPFRRVDDLAEIWCEWAELEVRADDFDAALRVLARATVAPKSAQAVKAVSFHDDTLTAQKRLFKSTKLWSFYVDLQESIGTVEGAKDVYDRILELKIATPQIIINYAAFLEENRYFEEAFKVYERGVEAFTYPVAFELWNVYLSKFVKRYAGSKIERARDLFEQALEGCPPKFAKPIFLKYGALEEEHGLSKRALGIYERACGKVAEDDRFDMYTFYIAKATANFGLAATRPIYERAIESLPDRQTAEMCLRFASLERKLGEIDRARAIYVHASQFCDPRTRADFWKAWNNFEIETGSEDTFREMLRVKRAVQAQFNTDISYIAASAALSAAQIAEGGAAGVEDLDVDEDDPMAQAEAAARAAAAPRTAGFVAATTTATKPVERKNDEVVGGEEDDDDLM